MIKKIFQIILIIIMIFCLVSMYEYVIYANAIDSDMENTGNLIQRSIISGGNNIDESSTITLTAEEYLAQKFPDVNSNNSWIQVDSSVVFNISGYNPIEVKSSDFPESEISEFLENNKEDFDTTYGGCGPIAIMGMIEYFLRAYPMINSIDTTLQSRRIEIIENVLRNIDTFEIEGDSVDNNDGHTFSFPNECCNGFYETLKIYNLENTIAAYNQGIMVSYDEKINKIKQQINKGIPVTMYTLKAGTGNLGSHYFNVYGYEEYYTVNEEGDDVSYLLFLIKPNLGFNNTKIYADSSLLNAFFSGIIYYDFIYDDINLYPSDFSSFASTDSENIYPRGVTSQNITVNDFSFDTTRIRCSYVDNQYLAFSSNFSNSTYANRANLEMDFSDYGSILKLELDVSKWSDSEGFNEDSIFKIEYWRENSTSWNTDVKHIIPIDEIPVKDSSKKIIFYFPYDDITKIRIYLSHPPTNINEDKGRIIINSMKLSFDRENAPIHYHIYDDMYIPIDEDYHRSYCVCGDYITQPHVEYTNEYGDVLCTICNYMFDEHEHIISEDSLAHSISNCTICGESQQVGHIYNGEQIIVDESTHEVFCSCGASTFDSHNYEIYEPYNESSHKSICLCGAYTTSGHANGKDEYDNVICIVCNYIIVEHTHISENEIIPHSSFICLVCNELIIVDHIYDTNYIYNDEENHLIYCECGSSITVEHIYDGDAESIDNSSHLINCCCGASTIESHIYVMGICKYCDYEHSHSYTYMSRGDGIFHTAICSCGLLKRETCIGRTFVGGETRCSKCGQIIGSLPTP